MLWHRVRKASGGANVLRLTAFKDSVDLTFALRFAMPRDRAPFRTFLQVSRAFVAAEGQQTKALR